MIICSIDVMVAYQLPKLSVPVQIRYVAPNNTSGGIDIVVNKILMIKMSLQHGKAC